MTVEKKPFILTSFDSDTNEKVTVTIEGNTKMPFWQHDLKVKAILALLNSIDYKDYYEAELDELIEPSAKEIIETAKAAFGTSHL